MSNPTHTIVYESTQNTIVLLISDDGRQSLKTTFSYAGIDYQHQTYWRCEVCSEIVPMKPEVEGSIEGTPFGTHAERHYSEVQTARAHGQELGA